MQTKPNRIYFIDNPYPNGHKIKEFVWSGRAEENGTIWFDFHLESDDYDAEDDSEEDEEDDVDSDWASKIVWQNYHRCTLSSTHWSEEKKGIPVKKKNEVLDFDACIEKGLSIDKLPLGKNFDYEDLAFNIYLLGHDSCSNHQLAFKKNADTYDIQWTGKLALTYAGDEDFDYDFMANIQKAKFDGFYYPENWTLEKATEFFKKNLINFEDYEFVKLNLDKDNREYKLLKNKT